jgi:hypothetical protein
VNSRRLLIVTSLSLLAGCGSDKAGGPTGLAGQLTFNYSGALSGTFNVTGQMPASQSQMETTSWATGEIIASGADAGTYIIAATPRTASTHDFLYIQANRTNAGTATIDFDNCTVDPCSTVFVIFGFQNGTGTGYLQDCYLQTGTITITEVTSTRVKGTFSGAGLCFSSTGTQTAWTVTNGTFDVALTPGVS